MTKERFKTKCLKIWSFLKKHYLLSSLGVFLIIGLFLFAPVLRSSWLLYPDSLRFKIALVRLEQLDKANLPCHEDCTSERMFYLQLLEDLLLKNREENSALLEEIIFNQEAQASWRLSILTLWRKSGLEPSEKITEYVLTNSNSPIKADIIKTWPNLGGNEYYRELIKQFEGARDFEKLSYLKLLAAYNRKEVKDFFLSLLDVKQSEEIVNQTLVALSNFDPNFYEVGDLARVKEVIDQNWLSDETRDKLVFLLGSYYDYFSWETQIILVELINDPKILSVYQRSFAIDILNHYRVDKVPLPALSQADWDAYFNK